MDRIEEIVIDSHIKRDVSKTYDDEEWCDKDGQKKTKRLNELLILVANELLMAHK